MSTSLIEAFNQRIHHDIPLTQSMAWVIESINDQELLAAAPLAPNINDKGTFFGGASAALMTVSGWAFIKYHLEQRGWMNDVVIHKSQNQWQKPQTDDARIIITAVQPMDWEAIQHRLEQEKNQKIQLHCTCQQGETTTTEMVADYAIIGRAK